MKKTRICFVCLGNICRSPTAEAVMLYLLEQAGRSDQFEIDSAGTAAYHVGEQPDHRSRQTARARGVAMPSRARKFERGDFDRFDHVLAMDLDNLSALQRLAPTDDAHAKVQLLRSFDPDSPAGAEVPDPYYGGPRGFEQVFDICEAACRGLLEQLP